MTLKIRVSTGISTPIYRQITDQIRRAIATSAQQTGDQLPSVRALAERLVVNPNTVARAYGELVEDGLLEAKQGKGYFIADRSRAYSKPERIRRLNEAIEEFLSEAVILNFGPGEIREALDKRLSNFKAQR